MCTKQQILNEIKKVDTIIIRLESELKNYTSDARKFEHKEMLESYKTDLLIDLNIF